MARGTSRRRVLGGIGVASLAVMSGGAIACGGDDDAGDDDAQVPRELSELFEGIEWDEAASE